MNFTNEHSDRVLVAEPLQTRTMGLLGFNRFGPPIRLVTMPALDPSERARVLEYLNEAPRRLGSWSIVMPGEWDLEFISPSTRSFSRRTALGTGVLR